MLFFTLYLISRCLLCVWHCFLHVVRQALVSPQISYDASGDGENLLFERGDIPIRRPANQLFEYEYQNDDGTVIQQYSLGGVPAGSNDGST